MARADPLTSNKFNFKKNQFYNVNVGLSQLRGYVGAFVDFDGDRRTDLVAISDVQKSIDVWLWDNADQLFKSLSSAHIDIPDSSLTIVNVVPGDFNYDGYIDLLVQAQSKPGNNQSPVEMYLYPNNGDLGFDDPIILDAATAAQPFVVDYNGDTRIDLLGVPNANETDSDNPMAVWQNQQPVLASKGGSSPANYGSELFALNTTAPRPMCRLAVPHSSAFVDLDGDCLPDIFVVCEGGSFQIWTNSMNHGFTLARETDLPAGTGPISFADVDGDGAMDIVFPVCNGGSCDIRVAYNKQIGKCSGRSVASERCRALDNLCSADPNFDFDLSDPSANVIVHLDQLFKDEVFYASDDNLEGSIPNRVHLGDYNLDGYPDMLLVTQGSSKSSQSGNTHIRLLESVPCGSGCSAAATNAGRRTFVLVTDGLDVLSNINEPTGVAFFDIDEDGKLDVLITSLNNGRHQTDVAYNNIATDGHFLRAQLTPADKHFKREKPYGVGSPGASFKYMISDEKGYKHIYQAVQMPQTAYRPLDTPYCILGLGRSTNYLERFSVGNSRQRLVNSHIFEGLIPNSHTVVFPFQGDNDNSTSSWRLELFMNRSGAGLYILITLAASLGVLGITVFVLNMLEKRADKHEKKESLHAINFDAL
ncbi:hypothetical protein EV182_000713 [Spiromyces aspiralis]|uniref:Uncharacterized protein n=1 Tax=Spiromyces aspiralis TaxID=68401 RepID=A0ACC1HGI0_9FUNG|nr:hypothetical protein EV182_000713 [Spiromyces aspiralis]